MCSEYMFLYKGVLVFNSHKFNEKNYILHSVLLCLQVDQEIDILQINVDQLKCK